MTTAAAYLRISQRKAKRRLEERVEGIRTEGESGEEGEEREERFVVVDSETGARLATVESCREVSEPDVSLSFAPRTRVEYRTDVAGTAARKLRRIREQLTDAASESRW